MGNIHQTKATQFLKGGDVDILNVLRSISCLTSLSKCPERIMLKFQTFSKF